MKKGEKQKFHLTSRVHFPLGYSAQVCVVMKGHLVKPSLNIEKNRVNVTEPLGMNKTRNLIKTYLESSSLGRVLKIMERVPIGDLRNNSTSPRRDVFKLMTGIKEKKNVLMSRNLK